jgi:hypothetical protein
MTEANRKAGAIGGRRTKETRVGIFNPAYDRAAQGHVNGLRNKERCVGIFAPDYDKSAPGRKGGHLGGKISGERNRRNKTGICAQTHADHVACGKIGGPRSCHVRWHVKRGILNPNCTYCVPEENLNEGRLNNFMRTDRETRVTRITKTGKVRIVTRPNKTKKKS